MSKTWCKYPDSSTKYLGTTEPPDIDYHPKLLPGNYQVHADPRRGLGVRLMFPQGDKVSAIKTEPMRTVLGTIATFLESEELYKKYNLIWKRGIIVYGPPGTGKTCMLRLVADKAIAVHKAIVIHATGAAFLAPLLAGIRQRQDNPIVVVMEDIDRFRHDSDLTQLLDGVTQAPGVVFLATTNYLHRLPPRLRCRPSRFDTVIEVPAAPKEAAMAYLKDVTGESEETLQPVVDAGEGLPFAHLKELFLATKVFNLPLHTTAKTMHQAVSEAEDDDDE